ncbi:MAG: 16S rRNA (guanine(527)-N(7))-methyltransferase RsmG [Crocinitomicaceae bacterium]|tara:strand:- start:2925 stop:3539 length:615 start_codon:yes stop_codon:yes gene_type:complete
MDLIRYYFPDFTSLQHEQLDQLTALYNEWNSKINVISRKDMENFRERHVLHSLALAKCISFPKGSHLLDIGTGGGFPGVPLAIAYPNCSFVLLDSIGKKLKVINEIAGVLGLKNIQTVHSRVEDHKGDYNYLISRAVTNMPNFMKLINHLTRFGNKNFKEILYLKGGDFDDELHKIKLNCKVHELDKIFSEPFFETKKVIQLRY